MSSLVLDPLQRVTRFKIHKGTTAVMAFCDHTATYSESGPPEDGPYMWYDSDDNVYLNPWWFDDVQKWKSVYETIGLKGVAFDIENSYDYPNIVPLGQVPPEGVPVVDVERPPAIDTLTQTDFRPTVRSHHFAQGVDPRFYIFIDAGGLKEISRLQPTLDDYLDQLREWRVPYRVIGITYGVGTDEPTGLGGLRWLQWLCAPFVGGFDLGLGEAVYDHWVPEGWTP